MKSTFVLTSYLVASLVALTPDLAGADTPTQAKTIRGAAAKDLFEALAAAHLPFQGAAVAQDKSGLVDAKGAPIDRTKAPLVIDTARLQCDYSTSTPYPDELESDVACALGDADWRLGAELPNPLALVRQLQRAGATFDPHGGGRTLKVTHVRCTRAAVPGDTTPTTKHYTCELKI